MKFECSPYFGLGLQMGKVNLTQHIVLAKHVQCIFFSMAGIHMAVLQTAERLKLVRSSCHT